MNLRFKFHDQLFWIHNFLPQSLYREMYLEFIRKRRKLYIEKTMVNWRTYKEEVDDMSESVDQRSEFNHEYFKKYHTFLTHQRFVNLINFKMVSHLRKFKYGQHLTWHSDQNDKTNRKYAATYYFNHRWNENWGGELMFKSDLGSGFIPIVGNSVVIVKCGLWHKVNANLKKTHQRFSVQTWVNG